MCRLAADPVDQVPMCPPFLDPEIYSEERDGATFLPSRFEEIVNAIADKIVESEQISMSLPPKRRCREQTWRILMLDLGRQKVTKKGLLRPWIRTNLISIAERVRNWEFLVSSVPTTAYRKREQVTDS